MVGHWWGYGGIQMNDTPGERVGIFSIWDFNNEESTIYAYNSDLHIKKMGRFGGEGTGVQFLFWYPWRFETDYRTAYRVFVEPDGVHARFSTFFYDADLGRWTYVVTHRANTGGQAINTNWLYSFNENYGGTWGHRRATMNNAWVYIPGIGWSDLTSGWVFNIPRGPNDFGELLTCERGFTFNSGPDVSANQAEWSPVSYTPSKSEAPIVIPYYLSAGNSSSVGNWEADEYFTSAEATYMHDDPTRVRTSLVPDPAPQKVYQHVRGGDDFQYNLIGFRPGASYRVRLHFVEDSATGAGQRLENVAINGRLVLKDFDIFETAGGMYRAVAESFRAKADSTGEIVVHFTTASGSQDSAVVSAIEATEIR
jgi:hypothetical protein